MGVIIAVTIWPNGAVIVVIPERYPQPGAPSSRHAAPLGRNPASRSADAQDGLDGDVRAGGVARRALRALAGDVEPVAVDDGLGGLDGRRQLLAVDRLARWVGGQSGQHADAGLRGAGLRRGSLDEGGIGAGVPLQALRLEFDDIGD